MDRATGRNKGCEKMGLFLPVHVDSKYAHRMLGCADGVKHVWAGGDSGQWTIPPAERALGKCKMKRP